MQALIVPVFYLIIMGNTDGFLAVKQKTEGFSPVENQQLAGISCQVASTNFLTLIKEIEYWINFDQ